MKCTHMNSEQNLHAGGMDSRSPQAFVYNGLLRLLTEHAEETDVAISIAAVARLFSVSRPSAERALRRLVADGTLSQTPSGKFRREGTPPAGNGEVSLEELVRAIPEGEIDATRQRGSWLQLYDAVQAVVVQTAPYGSYRINESAMAAHFGVSRTVTSEVLGRLEERGLIARGPGRRWSIERLSTRHIRNLYQLRRLLEPAALSESAPLLDEKFLHGAQARIEAAMQIAGDLPHVQADEIEHDLHNAALRHCGNERMKEIVRHSQVLRISHHHAPMAAASRKERDEYLQEHQLVFNALTRRGWRLAEQALVDHLERSEARALRRLEHAVLATRPSMASFLIPDPDDTDV